MDKKTYYVSVQAGTVMEHIGDSAFEFEIEATDEDVEQLADLFEESMEADHDAFWRAHTPAIPYHHDDENDVSDDNLRTIYSKIHELGTMATKKHIESMGVLENGIE